jgi:group II intron reverse transcriptase/maturase
MNTKNFKQLFYKEVISIKNLTEGLARTKNNVSPGIDGEIKKNITEKRLSNLHQELASQEYKPKPAKRVPIPKYGGGIRFLGIASQIDKVVQGALLEKLEPIFENIFLDVSFGFRPGRGCHAALKVIKYGWKAVSWVINVDIEKCFDKINHKLLLETLKEYCDQPTLELIRKLLKVGYVDIHNLSDRSEYNTIGTPQGSLISPILCNIFLHELDVYITSELLPKYNIGIARNKTSDYSKRYSLDDFDKEILEKYPSLKKSLARAKHNAFVSNKKYTAMNLHDKTFRRMYYVRYADDFLIGFTGPRKEAQVIFNHIVEFLNTLKLSVNQEKSKIYRGEEKGIKYLGMYLRYYKTNQIR